MTRETREGLQSVAYLFGIVAWITLLLCAPVLAKFFV